MHAHIHYCFASELQVATTLNESCRLFAVARVSCLQVTKTRAHIDADTGALLTAVTYRCFEADAKQPDRFPKVQPRRELSSSLGGWVDLHLGIADPLS